MDLAFRHGNFGRLLIGKDRKPKPDIYYGALPGQIDPRMCDNAELGTYIVPSVTAHRPVAPNFFVEAKGPSATSGALLDQACLDGAFGARGIQKLQTYGEETQSYDNKAYTVSTTYHAGMMKLYAHHLSQPKGPGTDPAYYMNQLGAYATTNNRDALVQAITAFRKAVDWTEKQRNNAIAYAIAA